ncbi:TIGR02453 family protein [Allosediminivita pacifica]|uniref:Uncharacterized protein (TIGR02453 family) n=1 Tax=Allosediminivita pacifica TaxID=1267769 RepID=A0A2T6B0M9_9RHOB|nr:TIGR02453 family protein [Allosediminivita pacifica]PTX49636.1 uncharacterized protein (TIGR02453 family) [Allosediminivita pacifica]GGB03416.1 hypothetical protein GCM10011324_12020 [Allosediminivita pacifica]
MAEAIDLTHFYDDTRAFLSELATNNDRDWFQAHKARYDSDLKRPAEKLLADLAPRLARLGGSRTRGKLFRPHRDMRFSEDKRPYNTHLHLLWTHPDGRGWFFGLSPDYATAGAGVMEFTAEVLAAYHRAVAAPGGSRLAKLLEGAGWRLDAPALARVPAPYSAEHPREALLRRKGLVAWQDNLDAALRNDPRAALERAFTALAPLQHWLATVLAGT